MSLATAQTNSGWHAYLRLGFHKSTERTQLAERERSGPLAVQRAFYPEGDLCHVYLLHPPGGVAGGDVLHIDTNVASGASALLTTPGAGKFYRSVGRTAHQQQCLRVRGGSLEWLPQENILFPGAKAEISTRVELAENASFIGWEIHCLGRPVIGERFESGEATFSLSMSRDRIPLLNERLIVDGKASLDGVAGLRGQPVVATLYATPIGRELIERLRETVPAAAREQLGITLVDGLLIARYLGDCSETAKRLFIDLWKVVRPALLNRPPCMPRIWNT